jgi:D-3-phosphoglycerate dehydrogenase
VGIDNIDVPALHPGRGLPHDHPGGVRRPVAVAAITFLLALSHKLLIKDRLTRAGRWAEKLITPARG